MILGHKLRGHGIEGVIVCNDWLADCTSCDPLLPYLDTETFTYAFTDIRGYGLSLTLEGEYTAQEAAADIFALADHLGWRHFHVVGYSMAGVIIEQMAITDEARMKSVVMIGAVSAAGIDVTSEERQFLIDTITDDESCRELANVITGHRLSRQWQDLKLRLARQTRAPTAARAYLDMWTQVDFSGKAGSQRPMLVLACRYDQPKLDAHYMEHTFLAWHPRAELQSLDSGHCPMQEIPVYLQTVMEAFMKRHIAAAYPIGQSAADFN